MCHRKLGQSVAEIPATGVISDPPCIPILPRAGAPRATRGLRSTQRCHGDPPDIQHREVEQLRGGEAVLLVCLHRRASESADAAALATRDTPGQFVETGMIYAYSRIYICSFR